MAKIVVIGGGGHAKALICILKKLDWVILGYTDKYDYGSILDVPYLGNDQILKDIINKEKMCNAAIGIGKIDNSAKRQMIQEHAANLGFTFPAIVSPHSIVNEDVKLGDGTIICDGAVIGCGVVTGNACIVNTNSVVEHDCILEDNVHVAPGAILSGGVTVGDHCLIGTGASIIQQINITKNCIVGAGSVVIKDLDVPGCYAGCPSRMIG